MVVKQNCYTCIHNHLTKEDFPCSQCSKCWNINRWEIDLGVVKDIEDGK